MRAPLSYRIREFFAAIGERFAALGRGLTSPFERVIHWFGDRLVHSGGGFERAEGGLVAIFRVLTWPVRVLLAGIVGLGRILLPEPVRNFWHKSVVGLGSATARVADALNLDAAVGWIAWATQPLWRPIAAVLGFLYAWIVTRKYRQMLWGIPALLLLTPVMAAAAWKMIRGPESVAADYQVAVKTALEAEDFDSMRLWERKLAQMGVDANRSVFQTAVALAKDEDKTKQADGWRRIEQLAAPDAPGYPSAHFWLVEQHLSQKGPHQLNNEQRLKIVDGHLQQLRTLGYRGEAMDLMRGYWLLQSGKKEEAIKLLEPIAPRNPMASSQLMLACVELNRPEIARREAARVRTWIIEEQKRGAPRTGEAMQLLAIAQQLLGDVQGYETALRDWIKIDPDRTESRTALGQLSMLELRDALGEREPDGRRIGQLMLDAASNRPDPAPFVAALGLLGQRADGEQIMKDLAAVVAEADDAPASLLMAVGTYLAQSKQPAAAEPLFARIVADDPINAVAWNNYAWVLMELGGAERLAQAAAAADKAVRIDGSSPSFHETRGQVRAKTGEWGGAVDDLEFALNGLPESKPTHAALAKAYRELGKPELAAAHEALAQ